MIDRIKTNCPRDCYDGCGIVVERRDEDAFKAPIREQYETQGHPYYATARLWGTWIWW